MQRFAVFAFALLLSAGFVLPVIAADTSITIGTAGERGVYYPAGGAICRLVKRGMREHGINCAVQPTSGSVYNLKALREGRLSLALAQTDWVYNAYKGTRDFAADGPDKSLRSVFSLHTEAFTVLTRADSPIRSIRDLKGRRIGIGDDGSGMRATAEEFIKAEGWSGRSFAATVSLTPAQQGDALCSGKVDVLLFTTGHPNERTREITHKCPTRLIAVKGPEIEKLLKDNPYYLRVAIAGGLYPGSADNTGTFGVKAVLVTSAKIDSDIIYQVVKAVFDNLDNFKTLHPVFATLDKTRMAKEGLVAPLHPGALRYFREAGLVK